MNRFMLIEVDNNDILEPDIFKTYSEAYSEMESRFNNLKDDDSDNNISTFYATIQSEFNNYDWRITEIVIEDNDAICRNPIIELKNKLEDTKYVKKR